MVAVLRTEKGKIDTDNYRIMYHGVLSFARVILEKHTVGTCRLQNHTVFIAMR